MKQFGKYTVLGAVLTAFAAVLGIVLAFDGISPVSAVVPEVESLKARLKVIDSPTYANRTENLMALVWAAGEIYNATNPVVRRALLDAYCSVVSDVGFNEKVMTNAPYAAIGAYVETIELACLALTADYIENLIDRRGCEKVGYEYSFEILLSGWQRLKGQRNQVDKIVKTWMSHPHARVSVVGQDTGQRLSESRNEQSRLARERLLAEIDKDMGRIKRRLELQVFRGDSSTHYSPGIYDSVVERYGRVFGRLPDDDCNDNRSCGKAKAQGL